MFTFLAENAAPLVVGLGVLLVVVQIIRSLYRRRKSGNRNCGGSCAGCPSRTACHEFKS